MILSEAATTPTPRILWIELTSKCPFDCVFCTRRVRFGAGRHLDFAIFERVIADLDHPDFIGLNYSGESIYYPRILDAIRLAGSTGALTELVTAFSTISPKVLEGLVEEGLDRLAISLHTVDPEEYQRIYRYGSLDALKKRVDELLELKAKRGVQKPRLDFCFVAMNDNLDQLLPVVEYARSVGVPELSVHPIIGRHAVPFDFTRELRGMSLREEFKSDLRKAVATVKNAHPDFVVSVLNPDIELDPRLSHTPGYYSPLLPESARIHTCDQSPFESVHILAGGNVVACEVLDEVPLGNLHEQSLGEIWQSECYRKFRQKYASGQSIECRKCVWKQAYWPEPERSAITVSEGMSPQLLRGWHLHEGGAPLWGRRQAVVMLANPSRKRRLRIKGALPHATKGNSVEVACNRSRIGEIVNPLAEFKFFDEVFELPEPWESLYVELSVRATYRPSLFSTSIDSRDLGIGLYEIEVR
jgi:MoaA/NifB/PqqE/SkfB family radical SAM enzyme